MTLVAVALWLLLTLLPGVVLLAAVRPAAGWVAVATAAPAVSLGLVHGWSVLLTLVGVAVEPVTVLPVAFGVPAVVGVLAVRSRGRGVRPRVGLGRPETAVVALVSLACLVLWWRATSGASLVPPNDDGNNHGLYAGRILALHTVDALQVTVGDLASGTPTGTYYPLSMHTVAALVSALGGGDPGRVLVVATMLAAAVALPFGMAVLTRRLFPSLRWAAPAAALLAVAFPAFPYYVSYWGGLALIAGLSLTAPLVDALVAVPDEPRPWLAGVVVGLGLAGMFGLHNTELVTVLLLAALLLVATWHRDGAAYLRRALPGLLTAGAMVVLFAVPQLGALAAGLSARTGLALLPAQSPAHALGLALTTFFGTGGVADAVLHSPRGVTVAGSPLFVVSGVILAALTLLGCVVAWRRGRPEWVVGLAATLLLTWWSAVRGPGADLLTIPWYSRWDRVAINELLFIAPLCAVGAVALAGRLAANRSQTVVGVVAGALVAVPLLPQAAASRQTVNFAFSQASLIHDPERAAFSFLAAHVRAGDRVLNDATDGSGWMWTLDGVTPVFTTQSNQRPVWGDRNYLQKHAADLATDPVAVAAADQWHVRWVYLGPDLFPFRRPLLDRRALLASPSWRTVFDVDGALVLERVGGAP
jgi:hypothetical protein